MASQTDQRFSSRIGLLLSVLGIAVGTGNIWRFPRIVAQNGGDEGGGAFLIAWITFLFLWSIPLIIAEYALGRTGRLGVIGTFTRVGGKKFAWAGAFVGLVSTAIMFYYSVVTGWCVYYTIRIVSGNLPSSLIEAEGVWNGFQGASLPLFFHAVAMTFGVLAVWKGVRSIERISMLLIPTLFFIVILCVLRAVTLDGAFEGLAFLFRPEWSQLKRPGIWLEALTQNAWDTGAGWGLILTYGAYMQRRHGVVKNAFITGIGNNTVSLLAATMIFGTVFAILGEEMSRGEILSVMQDSGPASTGLTFIWMPQLFSRMAFGPVLAVLFFLGLSFAAFTSLISMIELAVRAVVDHGVNRSRAILLVGVVGFAFGIPSAIDLNILGNQDFVWGVALIISGAFIALAIIRSGATRFREEVIDNSPHDWRAGRTWQVLITVIVPVQAVSLLGWWLYQSAAVYAPTTWYNPFEPFSVMTCLVQWGIALLVLRLLNNWLAARSLTGLEVIK